MTTSDAREKTDYRLERSRIHLLAALNARCAQARSRARKPTVEAAIEDELIALRIGLLCGR